MKYKLLLLVFISAIGCSSSKSSDGLSNPTTVSSSEAKALSVLSDLRGESQNNNFDLSSQAFIVNDAKIKARVLSR